MHDYRVWYKPGLSRSSFVRIIRESIHRHTQYTHLHTLDILMNNVPITNKQVGTKNKKKNQQLELYNM